MPTATTDAMPPTDADATDAVQSFATATGRSELVAHAAAVADVLRGFPMGDALPAGARLAIALEAGMTTTPALEAAVGADAMRLARAASRLPRPRSAADAARRLPAEGLRKMLLAAARDVRVIVIRLADELVSLRDRRRAPADTARPAAELALELYAPLANRLGIWQLKWELEDLAFRILEPAAYRQIALDLAETRDARERFVAGAVADLGARLAAEGIEAQVDGRPKHIYSIWKKMRRKQVGFDGVYDVRAVRVLVSDVAACYAALGVVHGAWTPVAGEFDDYIARPKRNGYRSLHTAVIGPDGRPFEVQIRSRDMHEHAELGVAAHWRYKEGGAGDRALEERIAWLRRLLDGAETAGDADDFVARFRAELFDDRVYVLTPLGDVVDLPAGATPVDLAYHLHTDLGHRCRGAKVNGQLVPLTHRLATGDQVEILAAKAGEPSRDWLNPHLGYVASSRARDKLRAFFRAKNHDENARAGREIVDRELARLGAALPYDAFVAPFGAGTVDGFFAKVGAGDVSVAQLAGVVQRELGLGRPAPSRPRPAPRRQGSRTTITLRGVGDLLYQLARCCGPLPPDAVTGYLTRGRGLTVHRAGCPHIERLRALTPERVVDVAWGDTGVQTFRVSVMLRAHDRRGLLRDVSAVLAEEQVNIAALDSAVETERAAIRVTLDVTDLAQLQRALHRLARLPGVVEARRAGA